MTDQQDLRVLPKKWRESEESCAQDGSWEAACAWQKCADELEAALEAAAQLGRVESLSYVPGKLDASSPPRVWLQIDTDGDNDNRDDSWPGSDVVTWHDESIGGLEIQYVRADLASPQLPAPVPDAPSKCRECGGEKLSWFAANRNNSQVAEGRLRTDDIECTFVLGCDECSETLFVATADEVAKIIAAAPQPDSQKSGDGEKG